MSKPEFAQDYLLYLLAAVSEAASAQFHVQVRQAGLRVPEWRVLGSLHGQDGAMVTHLAKMALAEQSRLTRIIVQMEKRGLVRRESDPLDGRRVRVFLTEDGRKTAESLVQEARRHECQLLDRLKQHNGEMLKPMLKRLLADLEQEQTGAH